MNWTSEARNVKELLHKLAELTKPGQGRRNEVERTQDEVRIRLGMMNTSVDYYSQFADDICRAYDRMKADVDAEESMQARHRQFLRIAASQLFLNNLKDISDEIMTDAVVINFQDDLYVYTYNGIYKGRRAVELLGGGQTG